MSANPFPACFPGRCGACGEGISVDEPIRFDAESDTNYVHDNCADREPAPERPVVVCQTCWLTKPCGCDDA